MLGGKIAVLVREPDRQYEALRSSLSLLLEMGEVQLFVLNYEMRVVGRSYGQTLAYWDEMKGERYSNNALNAEKDGFIFATTAQIGRMLNQASVVIPF